MTRPTCLPRFLIATPQLTAMSLFAGALGPAQAQTPPLAGQVVCHGDSLTWGANASSGLGAPGVLREQVPGPLPSADASPNTGTATDTTYPAVLARALGPAWHVRSLGTGGWNFGPLTGEAPAKIDPLFDPRLARNVLIIFGGTNDLGGAHESAETAFGKLTAYCRARKSAHPWRVLVVTPPVAAYPSVYPADFDTQMVRYGALIRCGWRSFADGIVDVQADPRLGAPGAERNPVYFNGRDFTHLTDAGYAIVGRDAASAVTRLSARSQRRAGGRAGLKDRAGAR